MAVGSCTVKQVGGEVFGRVQAMKASKYCHQCRQIAKGIIIACTKKKGNKFCTTRFCKRCLQNRYKQAAEEVTLSGTWHCPKCSGICNCSICSKKQVAISLGTTVHTPEASTDSSSAQELLDRSMRGLYNDVKDVISENHGDGVKKVEGVCTTEGGIRKENLLLPQPKTLDPTSLPPRKRLLVREMKHGFLPMKD